MNPTDPNIILLSSSISGDIKGLISAIQAGADINTRSVCNNTALMFASAMGYKLIVEILLVYGADKTLMDKEKLSASMYALLNGHDQIYEILK